MKEIELSPHTPAGSHADDSYFRLLFEISPIPMWVFAVDTLRFLEVNDAAIAHYGYSREEFLSMSLLDIRPKDEVPKILGYIKDKGLQPLQYQYTGTWIHRCKDGKLIHLEIASHRFTFRGENAVLSVVRDITEQKVASDALKESEDRFRLLSDAAQEAVIVHENYVIREVNQAFVKLFSAKDAAELIGKNVLELIPAQYHESVLSRVRNQDTSPYELEFQRANGELVSVEVRGRNIMYHGGIARVATLQNITARKQTEASLLERESKLRTICEQLSRSNRELEQFAYVTSHDLQEPLRMIASYVALIEKRCNEQLSPDTRELIHFAVDGAKRMKQLIEDLLSYARATGNKAPFARVDCNAIMMNVQKDLKLIIEETGAQIKIRDLPTVWGDQSQLTKLFQNLVSNAIKFRGDGHPSISISAKKKDGQWLFSFEDQGIGFDMRYSERIFRVFQRLHTIEEYPGTGIGLAICQKIVESHGGRIWAESKLGQGAIFHFTLPQSKPQLLPLTSPDQNTIADLVRTVFPSGEGFAPPLQARRD